MELKLAQLTHSDDHPQVAKNLWEALYVPYIGQEKDHFFRKHNGKYKRKSIFRQVDRIKLIWMILETKTQHHGCNLLLPQYIDDLNHPLVAVFPLHETSKKKDIRKSMTCCCSLNNLRVREIRDYFGEQIALHFVFLTFYTGSLLIPAVCGVGLFVWQIRVGDISVLGFPIYGLLICLWSSIFLKMWKRKEIRLRGKWGMTQFLQEEHIRPDFQGKWRNSLIDGSAEE